MTQNEASREQTIARAPRAACYSCSTFRTRGQVASGVQQRLLLFMTALLLGLVCMVSPAHALDHSGTCSGTFAAIDNPHRLTGPCTVPAEETLTIEPGVTLDGQSFGLTVNGVLLANGTETQPISFTNIRVSFSANSAGSVTNTTFNLLAFAPVLLIDNASPTIAQSTLSSNAVGGAVIAVSGSSLTAPTINNNTITKTDSGFISAGVQITGNARPTISNNTITTNTVGVDFSDSTGGSARGNTINFAILGSNGRTGIRVSEDAAPLIQDNIINDDPSRTDTGIVLDISPLSAVQIVDNIICATGSDTPLRLNPGFFSDAPLAQESGTIFSCGLGAGIGLAGMLSSGSATLRAVAGQSSFRIASDVSLLPDIVGAQFSIPAGMTLSGQVGATVRIHNGGVLHATGANFSNVGLDFRAGTSGSVTDNTFTCSAISTCLSIDGASPVVTGNTLSGAAVALNLLGTTTLSIDNNVFQSNATAISIFGRGVQATVASNVFDRNTYAIVFTDADTLFSAFPAMLGTNSFVGPLDKNLLGLPPFINVSGTLRAAPVPYTPSNPNGVGISTGATMTVEPGTVVHGLSASPFLVDGELVARGRPELPITFTGAKTGRWAGLQINNKTSASPTILDAVIIELAQGNSGALRLNNADIQIQNSLVINNINNGIVLVNGSDATITQSAVVQNLGHGIEVTDSNPTITLNSILNNAQLGVNNTTCPAPGSLLSAPSNYWGHDSGPLDNSDDTAGGGLFNPTGLGDEVSDCVNYLPWVRVGPSVEGTVTALSGGGQSGMIGTVLPQPLVVEIRGLPPNALPLADIDAIFSVVEGDAEIVEEQPVKTGADGRASVSVRLGLLPGDITIAVTARDVNSPLAIFTANGTSGFALAATPLELDIKPKQKGQPGDVNNDGRVSNVDAALLAAVLDGKLLPDVAPASNFSRSGDINGDGYITDGDVFAIQGYVVGVVPRRRW